MNKLLDLELEGYLLKDSIRQQLTLSPAKLAQCLQATQSIFSDFFCQDDLQKASWYSVNWLQLTDGTPLFKLTYGATATIWRINRGLKKI